MFTNLPAPGQYKICYIHNVGLAQPGFMNVIVDGFKETIVLTVLAEPMIPRSLTTIYETLYAGLPLQLQAVGGKALSESDEVILVPINDGVGNQCERGIHGTHAKIVTSSDGKTVSVSFDALPAAGTYSMC